ncbi:MAG TPA: hypothetical protein VF600_04705 [Abditibacteriaceae bacterium]
MRESKVPFQRLQLKGIGIEADDWSLSGVQNVACNHRTWVSISGKNGRATTARYPHAKAPAGKR